MIVADFRIFKLISVITIFSLLAIVAVTFTLFLLSLMPVMDFYYNRISLNFDCKGMDKIESKKELMLE